MSNALSHTPDGTPIDVRLLAHGPDGRLTVPSVTLEVDDHGPGLAKEQADGSSSGSTGPTRPAGARPAAPGWAWRSSPPW
jgi:signal transduction histidine kinase